MPLRAPERNLLANNSVTVANDEATASPAHWNEDAVRSIRWISVVDL